MKKISISDQNFISGLDFWYNNITNRGNQYLHEPLISLIIKAEIEEELLFLAELYELCFEKVKPEQEIKQEGEQVIKIEIKEEVEQEINQEASRQEIKQEVKQEAEQGIKLEIKQEENLAQPWVFQPIKLDSNALSFLLELIRLDEAYPKSEEEDTLEMGTVVYQKTVETLCQILKSENNALIKIIKDFLKQAAVTEIKFLDDNLTWHSKILIDMAKIKGDSLMDYTPLYLGGFLNKQCECENNWTNKIYIFTEACSAGNMDILENPHIVSPNFLSETFPGNGLYRSLTYRHFLLMYCPIEMLNNTSIFPETFLEEIRVIENSDSVAEVWTNKYTGIFYYFERKCIEGVIQSAEDILQTVSRNEALQGFLNQNVSRSLSLKKRNFKNIDLLCHDLIVHLPASPITPFIQNLLNNVDLENIPENSFIKAVSQKTLKKHLDILKKADCIEACEKANIASSKDIFNIMINISSEETFLTETFGKKGNWFKQNFSAICNEFLLFGHGSTPFLNHLATGYMQDNQGYFRGFLSKLASEAEILVKNRAVTQLAALLEEECKKGNMPAEKVKNPDDLMAICERFASKRFLNELAAPDEFDSHPLRTNFTSVFSLLIVSGNLPPALLESIAAYFLFDADKNEAFFEPFTKLAKEKLINENCEHFQALIEKIEEDTERMEEDKEIASFKQVIDIWKFCATKSIYKQGPTFLDDENDEYKTAPIIQTLVSYMILSNKLPRFLKKELFNIEIYPKDRSKVIELLRLVLTEEARFKIERQLSRRLNILLNDITAENGNLQITLKAKELLRQYWQYKVVITMKQSFKMVPSKEFAAMCFTQKWMYFKDSARIHICDDEWLKIIEQQEKIINDHPSFFVFTAEELFHLLPWIDNWKHCDRLEFIESIDSMKESDIFGDPNIGLIKGLKSFDKLMMEVTLNENLSKLKNKKVEVLFENYTKETTKEAKSALQARTLQDSNRQQSGGGSYLNVNVFFQRNSNMGSENYNPNRASENNDGQGQIRPSTFSNK